MDNFIISITVSGPDDETLSQAEFTGSRQACLASAKDFLAAANANPALAAIQNEALYDRHEDPATVWDSIFENNHQNR